MFWANEVVEKLVKLKKPEYLVSDYKTPSGKIHIGALRGVIIHDIVYKALKKADQKAKYNYGFDDFDPMDSFPAGLPSKFKKYIGFPLCHIPSPENKAENFGQFYAREFIKIFEILNVEPEIMWTSRLYKNGKFNEAIKIALENADKIRQIYQQVSGSKRSKNWYPFQVICPKCGKIGTTRVFNFKSDLVEFSCEKNLVSWAEGCGHKGKTSPYDGNGKLPWKVEWAAKWFILGTDFEAAGKDHYTKGGARDIAEAVAREVYKIELPLGFLYEFFLVSGKKMATSKGLGVSASEIAQILQPEILRFLMTRTQPQKPIEFSPEGDTIPRLYDFYDEAAEAFWGEEKSTSAEILAEVYKFSQIEKPKKAFRMRFSKVANLLQMPNVNLKEAAEAEKGGKLSEDDIADLVLRTHYAEQWLKNYAPESFKFIIQKNLPEEAKNLTQPQKQFLAEILKLVEKQGWQGDELHAEIHQIRKQMAIDPREAFGAIYLIFTGSDSGPQAGWFLASLDKNLVVKRLKEVVK